MRTYRIEQFGSVDGLALNQESVPAPGAGQVLVRIRASSLNFRDIAILDGWYPIPVKPGVVPLSDAAGEVEAVGAGVSRFKAGDRVVNSFFPNWFGGTFNSMPQQYVADQDGWLTEYKVVDAEALVAIPGHLSFEAAATLPCAGVTAWSALAGVGAGDTVLTQGTGGVSLFAVQLAKALGARVIATTSSKEKAERLLALGADHVIDYRATSDWGDKARALTNGRGVDLVVEVGGPNTLSQSIKAVALGGQVALVGVLAGVAGNIDFMSMFMSQASFRPVAVGSRRDLEDMIKVMSQHNIQPIIDSVYSLDDIKVAWSHFYQRKLFGKVVIGH
ncbi:zinc-dependent alcohol dehydrogenase family protein [Janthinobacterium agaricidamnosum]|uniref:Zinc-binding dehydrogenase family protein n=1 Tax=Janthinobacterium agaricidamnosum NBRC 102515 = DSM 9628 TaxID=1349767 RepID=W0V924_9BURK|nr:NAD(P)-dependent alcohol dehydrogenase [Janthinobacterium agaricidamnosum]CDG85329.1 zinc-binding dehydrogenase family protein [Janthinobacterium agaricidamnosum NBRC 102515 = DSM 9628]